MRPSPTVISLSLTNRSSATASFVPDDLLSRGGDGLKIVGRISDLINVAGKKVNPAQIEEQLLKVPGVREAIVFGRKSSQRNEEVTACVVGDATVNESDLLEFCRKHLSGWQVPKRIFIIDQIPVNERGKISRKELAARFASLESWISRKNVVLTRALQLDRLNRTS